MTKLLERIEQLKKQMGIIYIQTNAIVLATYIKGTKEKGANIT